MEEEGNEIKIGEVLKLNTCPLDVECFFIGPVLQRQTLIAFERWRSEREEDPRVVRSYGNELGILIMDTNCPREHPTDKDVRFFIKTETLLWI